MRIIFKKEIASTFPLDPSERYVTAFNIKLFRNPDSDGYYTDRFDEGAKDLPLELVPYVAQVSILDEFPAFPARQIGEYDEDDVHAVLDIRLIYLNGRGYESDRFVPLHTIKVWGADVPKVRDLYSRIRAGHVNATRPWDGHQVGAFNLAAELAKFGIKMQELQGQIADLEQRAEELA